MALMAGTNEPDIVVDVQPTPVIIESTVATDGTPQIRVVEAATPAPSSSSASPSDTNTDGS